MQQEQLTPSLLRQHYYSRYINIYGVLIVLAAILMGFFVYDKVDEYFYKNSVITQMQSLTDQLDKNKEVANAENIELNKAYAEQTKGINESLLAVFPKNENYTDVVREIDSFFQNINTPGNPAVVTSIKFDKPTIDKKKTYDVLPFSVNLNVTKTNFDKFLQYIYTSGDLKKQSRLLEIRSFSLTIPDEKSGKSLTLSVKMEAYMQQK